MIHFDFVWDKNDDWVGFVKEYVNSMNAHLIKLEKKLIKPAEILFYSTVLHSVWRYLNDNEWLII